MKFTSFPGRGLSPLILAASLAAALPASSAIVFVNADLEATPTINTVPAGWTAVPYNAPFSDASSTAGDDGDVLGPEGPNVAAGLFGAAHSGDSFVSGFNTNIAGITVQEGIQQTVTGFTVGEDYSFSFFQAVVGTTNQRDTEGSWKVFADGVLVATTAVTATTLAWDSPAKATDLVWEQRTVTFTATAESMTLSFLAYDPDGIFTSQDGLAMGLDSFSEITPVPEPATALLGVFGLLGLMRRRR